MDMIVAVFLFARIAAKNAELSQKRQGREDLSLKSLRSWRLGVLALNVLGVLALKARLFYPLSLILYPSPALLVLNLQAA
jgi:hypothetical protein